MENFDDIKTDWKNQNPNYSSNDMNGNHIVKHYIQKERNRKLKAIILLFLLLTILIYLIGFAEFQLWTTYVGLSIFVLVTLYIIYIRMYKRSKITGMELMNNNDFLSTLENEKDETCVGNSRQQTNLFIIYAIGFGFYIYETASQSTTSLIIGYGALTVYLIAAKFFYFPLMAKRNRKKTDRLIKQINTLQHQFEEK